MNEHGEEFGRDRLAQKILEKIDLPAKQLVDFIHREVLEFAGHDNLEDYWTCFW